MNARDWRPYARALDLRLAGATLDQIAKELDVSRERARQMIKLAKAQLAFRIFRGLPRPLPETAWITKARRDLRGLPPGRDWLFVATK